MKKNLFIVLSIVLFASYTQAQTPYLEKKWEVSGLNNPESIVFNHRGDIAYVSNINGNLTEKDGNGYITTLSDVNGTIAKKVWITGLNAPKGLAIYKDKLYVADIDEIVEIDIPSASIINKYKAEGATFLNDLAIDKNGVVYASNTFGFSAIYKLENGKVELWRKSEALGMPNGLLFDRDVLVVSTWGENMDPNTYQTELPGQLLFIDPATKCIDSVSIPIGNLDGLAKAFHGYIVTDWIAGKIYYYANHQFKELLTVGQGSADLAFQKEKHMIYVPLLKDNKVVGYSIHK